MNALDWILLVLAGLYALSGYWQGFITGAFATVGLLAGGALGIWLAPQALGNAAPSLLVALGALFIVILSASLGQAIFQLIGSRIRNGISWRPVRALDAVGGALLSAAAVLVVAWALGSAIAGTRLGPITGQVRESRVLAEVDRVLPAQASRALAAFNNVVGTTSFPNYLEPFARERIIAVSPGPKRMLTDPDVNRAGESVLKVHATNKCNRGMEGSGFVYAPNRLMTNAHVVAGAANPEVLTADATFQAKVVYYNADLDVAVLAFDSAGLSPLRFDKQTGDREGVAVLGYPEDGPFQIQPARVRSQQKLRSPNIYGRGTVLREVYSLRGKIRPGNSGGPIVNSDGQVAGVVFAASVTDPETGYALTARQVADAAVQGLGSSSSVSTGACG